MNLSEIIKSGAYEHVLTEDLADIHAEGYLLRHKKSGARVMLIPSEDDNKVFNIAFRTPPADSTGVAHIIEHTVLCGSRQFPVKDPFVELVKGSLNTFLNAMTYPDKTMYPVASTNDADFRNLMNVYLDAVFYPNIYREEKIFRQEGWHYEMESPEDDLTINGVVYNEMKGAFSSADEYLERVIFNGLFPDTSYGVESGGDPKNIPDLTYEQFLNFHSRYYHPSNSYIYLYGDMDMADTLAWLDEKYLSAFEKIEIDSEIKKQAPFAQMKRVEDVYPIADEEDEKENTYLAWNVVTGDPLSIKEMIAYDVLDYALLSMPGAPVREALLEAGIGRDVTGAYNDGILQPYFSVEARGAEREDADRFEKIIRKVLTDQAEGGIDKKSLMAGINYLEFQFREADYATYPKGLMYSIDVFDSWLYDENAPFVSLKQLAAYEELRHDVETGYFEKLIKENILANPHGALIILSPEKGLSAQRAKEDADRLAAYKASLSDDEIRKIIDETKALKEYQSKKDTPEDLMCLPMLSRDDIRKEARVFSNIERSVANADGTKTDIILHKTDTNGIGYLELLWDVHNVPERLLPTLGLLKGVLANVNTASHTYMDLNNEINANTGGINCGVSISDDLINPGEYKVHFGIHCKALYSKMDFALEMIREIICESDFSDSQRLYDIITMIESQLQSSMQAAGHATAVGRTIAYFSATGAFSDYVSGLTFYKYIKDIADNFEDRMESVTADLNELLGTIFDPKRLLVGFTADEEGYEILAASLGRVTGTNHVSPWTETVNVKPFGRLNEAFRTAGTVQYVAQSGDFFGKGYEFNGAMQILRQILSYEYLWQNVRVLGGAYGCSGAMRRTGQAVFSSYRDPHLQRTLDVYAGIPEFLENFEASEQEMTKYIIGTFSALDIPFTPSLFGSLSMRAYINGATQEMRQKMRDEVLNAQAEDIRSLAPAVKGALDDGYICVVGSETEIEKHRELFNSVETLV